MEATIKFTKETKDKMAKGLTIRERGKLRFGKIKELDENGKLAFVKNRKELAAAAGYTPQQRSVGYAWVENLIHRGHITEEPVGYGKNGKLEYIYHVKSSPLYDENIIAARARAGKKGKKAKNVVATANTLGDMMNAHVVEKVTTEQNDTVSLGEPKMAIKYGNVELRLYDKVDAEYLVKVIKLLNGEEDK